MRFTSKSRGSFVSCLFDAALLLEHGTLKLQFLKTTHHAAFGVLNAAHGFFETLFRPEGHRVIVYIRKWAHALTLWPWKRTFK